jgi:hypothetical protein
LRHYTEDSFDPTKIDGKSLEPCPGKNEAAKSGELTAKSMADFDGAFLSFKVTKAGVVAAVKDGLKLSTEEKTGLANAAKDVIADKTGTDIPDIPDGADLGGRVWRIVPGCSTSSGTVQFKSRRVHCVDDDVKYSTS